MVPRTFNRTCPCNYPHKSYYDPEWSNAKAVNQGTNHIVRAHFSRHIIGGYHRSIERQLSRYPTSVDYVVEIPRTYMRPEYNEYNSLARRRKQCCMLVTIVVLVLIVITIGVTFGVL